jgi:hypothetical protein
VVAKVRETLTVRKHAARKFDWERFNLRRLNELEVRKDYQIESTNRFSALENLSETKQCTHLFNITLVIRNRHFCFVNVLMKDIRTSSTLTFKTSL